MKIITMFGDIIGVLFALKYVGGSGDSKALSVGLGLTFLFIYNKL